MDILNFDSRQALVDQAAKDFVELVKKAQQEPGACAHVVLTGGGCGIGLLESLRTYEDAIDWSRLHVYFGDERNVAITDPESNEGQARQALLDHVAIPEENIHGFCLGELDLDSAVKRYTALLPAHFDLHLMGMGGEGHINSIFPHSAAVAEKEKLVMAVTDSPKPPAERVTLTFPAIEKADEIWLLVSGEEKAEAAQHVIDGSPAQDWPAAGVGATRLYLN